jgi:hypothetical protein
MVDWNKLATPAEITYENIADAIGYAYARDIEPRRVFHLILEFGNGRGSTEIPPARYSDFLAALGKLR